MMKDKTDPYERDKDGWLDLGKDFRDNARREIARAVIEAEFKSLETLVTRKDEKGRQDPGALYFGFAVYNAEEHAVLSLDIAADAPFPMLRGCFVDELEPTATAAELAANPLAHIRRDGFHETYDLGKDARRLVDWGDDGWLGPLSPGLMGSLAAEKLADALSGHMAGRDCLLELAEGCWHSAAFDKLNKDRELADPEGCGEYFLSINAKQVYMLGGDLRIWDSPRMAAGEDDMYAWVGTPISAEGMERICDALPGRSGTNPGDGSPTVDYLDIDLSSPFKDGYGAQAITSLDMEPGLMERWNKRANRHELDCQRLDEELFGVPSADPALEDLEEQGLI